MKREKIGREAGVEKNIKGEGSRRVGKRESVGREAGIGDPLSTPSLHCCYLFVTALSSILPYEIVILFVKIPRCILIKRRHCNIIEFCLSVLS